MNETMEVDSLTVEAEEAKTPEAMKAVTVGEEGSQVQVWNSDSPVSPLRVIATTEHSSSSDKGKASSSRPPALKKKNPYPSGLTPKAMKAVVQEEEQRSQVILSSKSSRPLGYRRVLFRAIKVTEPQLKQAAEDDEASTSLAVAPQTTKHPYGLTSEALTALGEEGSQVLLCSGPHHRMLFCGSKPLKVRSVVPCPAPYEAVVNVTPAAPSTPDDIFLDIDPNKHMLIVQFVRGRRKKTFRIKPTEDAVQRMKAMVARSQGPNGASRQACSRNMQQLSNAKDSSDAKPVRELPSSINAPKVILRNNNYCLLVIKKVSRKMDTGNDNTIPELPIKDLMGLMREKEQGCSIEVIHREWKLTSTALPMLPLVPSLSSHLPWVYMANPRESLGNHIFGNMMMQQSILVANSNLQARLLYSRDGWLLFHGKEGDYSFGLRFPSYPIYLLNPTTGARIDLPNCSFKGAWAAFCMTTQGTPGTVVYVSYTDFIARVYIVRPGDACWEEYPCDFRLGPGFKKMVLCGSSVYCFFSLHCLVFNITDLCWHHVTRAGCNLNLLDHEGLELEGEVVMVGNPECLTRAQLGWDSIPFFILELSGDKFEWVDITGRDEVLNGRIWFIHELQSFCVKVKGSGQKVCWFAYKISNEQHRCGVSYAVHCLNLTTRAHCRLTADSFLCGQHAWVDLGCPSDYSLLDWGITGDDLLPGI